MSNSFQPFPSPSLPSRLGIPSERFRAAAVMDNHGHIQLRQTLQVPELEDCKIVAIVPTRDEEQTLAVVLEQLMRLPLAEIVVVINGSSDLSGSIARHYGCHVVEIAESLGHDVGRAVGAAAASKADLYFFTDADVMCLAEEYVPFLVATASGVDVALNDVGYAMPLYHRLHPVNVAKTYLNYVLGRPDLGIGSLTGIPHALSHRALEVITPTRLAVPPLAHAMAILEGLQVQSVAHVDVVSRNRAHRRDSPDRSPVVLEKMIVADHLEALAYVQQRLGIRGIWGEDLRRRDLIAPSVPVVDVADSPAQALASAVLVPWGPGRIFPKGTGNG